MSDAIAISSPNGKMSKRARETANERLRVALFGAQGLQQSQPPQPDKRASLLRHARELRELAARGMKPRAFIRQAEQLERQAETP